MYFLFECPSSFLATHTPRTEGNKTQFKVPLSLVIARSKQKETEREEEKKTTGQQDILRRKRRERGETRCFPSKYFPLFLNLFSPCYFRSLQTRVRRRNRPRSPFPLPKKIWKSENALDKSKREINLSLC